MYTLKLILKDQFANDFNFQKIYLHQKLFIEYEPQKWGSYLQNLKLIQTLDSNKVN